MLKELSEIAPKAAVIGAVAWATANYFVIGPEVASRVVRADHLPVCETNFRNLAISTAEQKAASLTKPVLDEAKEMAANHLRQFRDDPLMGELRRMGLSGLLGIDRTMSIVDTQYQQQKRAAIEAYNAAVERLKQETATELGRAGGICGCVGDAAIAQTRTEWAIYSGSLALVRPAPLKSFDAKMSDIHRSGICSDRKAGA